MLYRKGGEGREGREGGEGRGGEGRGGEGVNTCTRCGQLKLAGVLPVGAHLAALEWPLVVKAACVRCFRLCLVVQEPGSVPARPYQYSRTVYYGWD